MLVIRRRAGQAILIGGEIEVEIVDVSSGKVVVGIRAPKEVPIVRREIRLLEQENRAASESQSRDGIFRLAEQYFR